MPLIRACVCCNKVESLQDAVNVAEILDKLGYTKSLAEKRVDIYKNAAKGGSLVYREKSKENIDIVVAGSRGEGIGIYFDTDVDKLFVQRSVKCFESQQGTTVTNSETIQLFFDTEGVPSGYTKLVLRDQLKSTQGNFEIRVNEALVDINGELYLQNTHLLTNALSRNVIWDNEGWLSRNLKLRKERIGPSKPYIARVPFTTISISVDDVLAFPSCCPKLVSNWVQRERTHGWPSTQLIKRVEELDVLVVPVGVKDHREENLQWRISFSLAELELVWSFNDTQVKVYTLLKMLAKSQLKVVCKKITSYVVKNVFFWLSEKTNISELIPENITNVLIEALVYLRKCIAVRSIPNYMISDRDHYEEISEKQRNDLLKHLDTLIGDTNVIMRCSDVKRLVTMSDRETEIHIIEREVGEQLILSIFSFDSEIYLDVLKQLFAADTKEDVRNVFKTEVVGRRRQEDPFCFFNHIRDMTDDELAAIFLRNVTKRGFISCILKCLFRPSV